MVERRILFGLFIALILNASGILGVFWYTHSDTSTRSQVLLPHAPLSFNITHPSHIIVFLHIQKTGGSSFEDSLVNNIVNYTCPGEMKLLKKKSKLVSREHRCFKSDSEQQWIFTRKTVGWPCGVHVDYTSLSPCARNYLGQGDWDMFLITLLRDPIDRFYSEFLHVKRGADWPVYEIDCSNRTDFPRKKIAPKCKFFGNVTQLTIEEFMNCADNPAINRMTHMLAGYGTIQCKYNPYMNQMGKDTVILETAKKHLKRFEFFGILEFSLESAKLFEDTFSVQFIKDYIPKHGKREKTELTSELQSRIASINKLDVKLYAWASELFKERIN